MKRHVRLSALAVVICLTGFGIGGWVTSQAVETSTEYEISVPAYKSDTVRMIEAYERLSDQYLTLVQHHLKNMDASDQRILQKLEALEKKVDALSTKLDALKSPPKEQTQKEVLY